MEIVTMHRLTSKTSSVVSCRGNSACAKATRKLLSLVAIAGIMSAAPVIAKDPPRSDAKPASKAPQGHENAETVMIPECMEKLKLTPEQQVQVKEIIHNYNGSIGTVWNKFSARYMQAIEMETSLLAAIEDGMTEPQRLQVRNQRKKTAQHEKAIAATSSRVNQAETTPNEETKKPATAAEEGLAAAGVSLSDEQEAAADKLQEKYRTQLRSLNRDIQGLHTQLVSLEADKLVELEKVLTKDQLAQLRTIRQSAPSTPKVANRKIEPVKAE